MEFESIEEIVLNILKNDIRARNSDKWLIIQVLRKMGFKIFIDYSHLGDMPSFETITRIRRKLQNDEDLFPPTDERVISQRHQKEDEFREIFKRDCSD